MEHAIKVLPMTRAGFALRELAAVIIVLTVALALAIPAGERTRRSAQLGQDFVKLHDIAAGTALYGYDHADRIWSLSWQSTLVPEPVLTDMAAQARQAVHILRTHGGRPDMPQWANVIANVRYSHLPLAAYLDAPLPWFTFISSGDQNLLRWASDPACHDANCFFPCQLSNHPRYPYWGSFELVPAAWDRSEPPSRLYQASYNSFFVPPGHDLGGGLLTDITFPSHKVLVMDNHARHFGNQTQYLFNHPEARLPLLFGDGSSHLKRTRDSNPGWRPFDPSSPSPLMFPTHKVVGQCTPGVQGGWQTTIEGPAPGVFRWTRSGLAGRDFGGPEVWLPAPAAAPGRAIQPEQTLTVDH